MGRQRYLRALEAQLAALVGAEGLACVGVDDLALRVGHGNSHGGHVLGRHHRQCHYR